MAEAAAVIPTAPTGCTPWAWAALSDVAREAALALWADHRLRLHMAGFDRSAKTRGPWVAWVVDQSTRPWKVGERCVGWGAETVAYRAIRGALAAWRTAP